MEIKAFTRLAQNVGRFFASLLSDAERGKVKLHYDSHQHPQRNAAIMAIRGSALATHFAGLRRLLSSLLILDMAFVVPNRPVMKLGSPLADPVQSRLKQRVRLDPAVRRRQIVAEATRLIARSGFNGVSLSAVADACDVRKSTILHYFPSMKELLVAVLEGRDARDFKTGQALGEQLIDSAQARATVTAKFVENLEQREIIRLFYVLAAEALSPEHPAHEYFRERSRRAKRGLLQILAWKADPPAAALELSAFWQGLELEWLTDPQADVLAAWHNFAERFFER